MLTSFEPKSIPWHRLTRFVSKKAIAMLLNVKPEDIYEIRRWRFVLLVVGKHISCFVSYADLPIVRGVAFPDRTDCKYWLKRWKGRKPPQFWVQFYVDRFQDALSEAELRSWGRIVNIIVNMINVAVTPDKLEWLRGIYGAAKTALQQMQAAGQPAAVAIAFL